MTAQLSRELLEAKIKRLEEVQRYRKNVQHVEIGLDLNADEKFQLEAYRELLAGMESEPVAWLYEDELPENYPYDSMFQYSKVDIVRMFPVFAPPAPVVSINKVKLGEWLDSEVGGVRPEQYDFYVKSFYENVMPAPVAVHDAIRLLQSEITIWKDRWESLRELFREVADALGCDVKDNTAMLEKIAMLKAGPVTAADVQIFVDRFESLIEERDKEIECGQLGCSNYQALIDAARDAFNESFHPAAPEQEV